MFKLDQSFGLGFGFRFHQNPILIYLFRVPYSDVFIRCPQKGRLLGLKEGFTTTLKPCMQLPTVKEVTLLGGSGNLVSR